MKCPTCQNTLLEKAMFCENCLQEQSYRTALEHQKMFLPSVEENRAELVLVFANKWSCKHIQLIQAPVFSYCGSQILGGKKTTSLHRDLELNTDICRLCLTRLKELIAECHSDSPAR